MPEELTAAQQAEIAVAKQTEQQRLDQQDGPRNIAELIAQRDLPPKPDPEEETGEEKPAKKAKKKELTPEEIDKTTELLGERLGFRKDKTDDKDQTEKDKEDRTDDKQTGKDDLEGKEKKPKKVKVTRKEPLTDPADLVSITAAKTARAVAEELRIRPEPEKAKDPFKEVESGLLENEKADYSVFQQMAEDNPRYKDLPKQYLASIQRVETYKQRWERDNPGDEFDPDSEEHDDFFSKNNPDFEARDFRKAEARMEAKSILAEREKAEAPKRKAEIAESAIKDLEPTLNQTRINAAAQIVNAMGEDYLPMIEKEGFEKFAEADPVAAETLQMSALRMNNFLTAARHFDDPKGRIPYNPELHKEYADYMFAKEAEFAKKPMRDRYNDDGQLFLPRSEYVALPANKRGDYWYLDADKLIEMRVAEEVDFATKRVEKENEKLAKLAKLRGWTTNGVGSGKPKAGSNSTRTKAGETEVRPSKPASEEIADDSEVRSPEAGGGGKLDTAGGSGQNGNVSFLDRSHEILFRR